VTHAEDVLQIRN